MKQLILSNQEKHLYSRSIFSHFQMKKNTFFKNHFSNSTNAFLQLKKTPNKIQSQKSLRVRWPDLNQMIFFIQNHD